MSDPINPSHYDGTAALEAMVAKHGLLAVIGFCECSFDEYMSRASCTADASGQLALARALRYQLFAAELRGRLPQGLLTGERLARMNELLLIGDSVVGDLIDADDVRDLIADRAALQAFYTTREKELRERVERAFAWMFKQCAMDPSNSLLAEEVLAAKQLIESHI